MIQMENKQKLFNKDGTLTEEGKKSQKESQQRQAQRAARKTLRKSKAGISRGSKRFNFYEEDFEEEIEKPHPQTGAINTKDTMLFDLVKNR